MNEKLNEFILENTKAQWQYPITMPENLWASTWPWAPVIPDISLDLDNIRNELYQINHLFVEHRAKDKIKSYGHNGWFSVTLHGIEYDKTENYDRYGFQSQIDANYHWTSICDRIPNTVQAIKSLPFENYGRVRIMRLDPMGYIMPHVDGQGRIFGPFNFALNNPVGCKFVMKDFGIVPFRAGMGFLLDIGVCHAVFNESSEYRYHVIIHGAPNNNIQELVKKSINHEHNY